MVLISFGNIAFVIHRINYRRKNPRQKIHFRMKLKHTVLFSSIELRLFFDRVKAEFIRMKYQQMAYINRLKDETNGTLEDLNLVIGTKSRWKWNVDIWFYFSNYIRLFVQIMLWHVWDFCLKVLIQIFVIRFDRIMCSFSLYLLPIIFY